MTLEEKVAQAIAWAMNDAKIKYGRAASFNDWAPDAAKRFLALPEISSALAERDAALEALTWLGDRHDLSVEWNGPVYGDDDEPEEWRVYRESGGINDREWTVVGAGATVLEAIRAARAASLLKDNGGVK
jgi:hypothetical protein